MVLVGVSLSVCVGDLLRGDRVWSFRQRLVLVTCTAFSSPEEAYAKYSESYWRGYPKETVMALLKRIWPHVVQPRLLNDSYEHFAGRESWFTTTTLNVWEITNGLIERDESAGRISMYNILDDEELLLPVWKDLVRVVQAQASA